MTINPAAIAEGIVGLILSTSAVDTVAVFDSGFNQLFPNARPLQDQVRENSRIMDHPLESGQLISDYKIVLPVEIELPVIITSAYYLGTYQQIKAIYLSSELLTVQTRANTYPNMIISEMPHQEDPERYDAITMLLKFRQVQLVQPSTTGNSANPAYAPADPTQTPTQNAGQQAGSTVSGINGPNGLQPFPYSPATSPLYVGMNTVDISTPSGAEQLPVYPSSPSSISGLPQSVSSYNSTGVSTGGQSSAGANALALTPPQAAGLQGGL